MVGGIRAGAEAAIPIHSAAFIPGYLEGGGQHLIRIGMKQLSLMGTLVTRTVALVLTTPWRQYPISRDTDSNRSLRCKKSQEGR